MNTFKKLALAAGLCAAGFTSHTAQAQSTDGYHTIQIIPVAVDTASFAQRFNFRNPNSSAMNVAVIYLPGTGTTQGTQVNCATQNVAAGADKTVIGLRTLCPGIVAGGSQFGFLYMYETSPTLNLPFAVFSRVANPQGNGFTVEGFPAHTFTSAASTVIGVRRAAATLSSPAYQTNCFVGNLYPWNASAVTNTSVFVYVYNSAGAQIGATTEIPLLPGKFTRLLDIFAAVGAPAGDYNDARVRFVEAGDGEPGLIEFCTTQENTTFGADFRIAKQEASDVSSAEFAGIAQHDSHVARDNSPTRDILLSPAFGAPAVAVQRAFTIPVGGYANTHVMYFRHPDWIFCEVINPSTGLRTDAAYGLEMRMLANDGLTLVAGGNGVTGFGPVYLGNKEGRNDGANSRYTIEVEANGTNGLARPYRLHCQSGSGHTGGDIVRYQDTPDRF